MTSTPPPTTGTYAFPPAFTEGDTAADMIAFYEQVEISDEVCEQVLVELHAQRLRHGERLRFHAAQEEAKRSAKILADHREPEPDDEGEFLAEWTERFTDLNVKKMDVPTVTGADLGQPPLRRTQIRPLVRAAAMFAASRGLDDDERRKAEGHQVDLGHGLVMSVADVEETFGFGTTASFLPPLDPVI